MSKYLKFKTPAAAQAEDLKSRFGISNHGLVHVDRVYWNLPAPALYEEAIFRNEGFVAHEFIPTWDDKIAALRHGVQVCDV